MTLDALSRDALAALVPATVRVVGPVPAELELVEVTPAVVSGPFESFTLLLRGTATLGQGTYVLEHDDLGRLELFVVPVGPDGHGVPQYEIVFNRAAPGAAGGG